MKKLILIFSLFLCSVVKAEEQSLHIVFSGNINDVPIQVDNIKKDTRNTINLTLNKWSVTPKVLKLIESKSNLQKIANENQLISIQIKYKF